MSGLVKEKADRSVNGNLWSEGLKLGICPKGNISTLSKIMRHLIKYPHYS